MTFISNLICSFISFSLPLPALSSRSYLDVTLKPPRVKEMFIENKAVLECIITGQDEAIKEVEVTWMLDSVQVTDKITQTAPEKADHLFRRSSILTLAAKAWEGGKTVTCSVQQKGGPTTTKTLSQFPVTAHLICSSISLSLPLPVLSSRSSLDVTLKPPRIKEMFIENKAVLECIITGEDEAIKEAVVTWMLDSVQVTDKITQTGPEQAGHLFRKSSILTLAVKDWEGGKTVKCSVLQKGGPTITKTLSTTKPTVSIQTPSPEDLDGKSEFFLVCLVTGFYPEEIYIMWQVDGGKYEEGITGEPLKTGDKYSVTSLFKVSKLDWDKGNRYSCNARHASQEGNLTPSHFPLKCQGGSHWHSWAR
uniref:Ig-like domain-containing protein n=1 Tax=Paramormyrops kingsleyae TaxID=1676925 RepID=A0A3B3R814_9TELE